MRIEVDLENVNFKVITNEGAKCGFCNKKLKPVGLSYLYANVNHDMVEYERCDCSEAIAFWKQYDSKQNEKEKEVTEINEGAISGISESTSRNYIFIF